MSRPFVSSERRADLISGLARLKTQGDQKPDPSHELRMKDPFEKKDVDKKEVEKKDLKESKDEEQGQHGCVIGGHAPYAFSDEAPSNIKIGHKWADKPAKFIRRDPPV